jgi:hypothetical protein
MTALFNLTNAGFWWQIALDSSPRGNDGKGLDQRLSNRSGPNRAVFSASPDC